MAPWRYDIYLLLLKNILLVRFSNCEYFLRSHELYVSLSSDIARRKTMLDTIGARKGLRK